MNKQEDPRIIVRMRASYTTASMNVGRRTYEEGECYQVCKTMLDELLTAGAADEITSQKPYPRTPIKRDPVTVIPNVTRWISANGIDRHDLVAGKPVVVPSNLAVFLTHAGLATAA